MTATLGAILLSALLAQSATPTPAPIVPSPTAGPTSAPSSDGGYIRRGPETAPRMINANPRPGDATIVNSGSTNTAGYTIVVHPDRSADVTVAGVTKRETVGAAQARWLFYKLRSAMPLGELPGGHCMKSMSFGSTTTIAYEGQTTPDLSCVGDAKTRELGRIASVIVDRLQIPAGRTRGIQLPLEATSPPRAQHVGSPV